MSKQMISLVGPIGTFAMKGKMIQGIQLQDVVAQVAALPLDTTEIQVDIGGPGGLKPVGDQIYNFLLALKRARGIKLIMNQVDDVGSIMSKIWFAGDERIMLLGINPRTGNKYEIFIHNPWMRVEGDAVTIQAALDKVKPEEEELQNFYMAQTGIPAEGIKPLMANQTGLDAELAVKMKFATGTKEALSIAAYNMEKNPKDQKQVEGLLEVIKAFFTPAVAATAPAAAAAPAAGAAPGAAPATAAESPLKGKAVLIDGGAAPDGVYSVKGGVVTAVEPLAEEAAEPAAMPAALAASVKAIEDFLASQKKAGNGAQATAAVVAATGAGKTYTETEIKAMIAEGVNAGLKSHKKPEHKDVIIDFKDGKSESAVQAYKRKLREGKAA